MDKADIPVSNTKQIVGRLTLCRWAATAETGHLLRNLTVGSSGGL